MVNEYGEDELAKDSDDEKRIAKAVDTSERKAAQLKKKSHTGHGNIIRAGQLTCWLELPPKIRISRS